MERRRSHCWLVVASSWAVESPAAEPLVRNGARLDGRCFTTGTLCLCTLYLNSSDFFSQRRRALTCTPAFKKKLSGEGKGRRRVGKKSGLPLQTVLVFTGESCRHQHPRYPPLNSLNGWDSLGLCSSAQAKRLETTFEYPSVWRLEGNAQKCPAASLQLNSEDLSCICAFCSQGRTLLKVYNRKENSALKWQLSHYIPRYGLYVFIDVLFTLSTFFGSYFRCRNTWWVVHLLFLQSVSILCALKSLNVEGQLSKNYGLIPLIGPHNKSDSLTVMDEVNAVCWTAWLPFLSAELLLIAFYFSVLKTNIISLYSF